MGTYSVDVDTQNGMLRFRLEGHLSDAEAQAFVAAHNAGVDRLHHRGYVVYGDLRDLRPLSPECAAIVEQAKRYSASQRTFRGSATLTRDRMVALQHRRTSISGGVMTTELISDSESECEKHLASVRGAPSPPAR